MKRYFPMHEGASKKGQTMEHAAYCDIYVVSNKPDPRRHCTCMLRFQNDRLTDQERQNLHDFLNEQLGKNRPQGVYERTLPPEENAELVERFEAEDVKPVRFKGDTTLNGPFYDGFYSVDKNMSEVEPVSYGGAYTEEPELKSDPNMGWWRQGEPAIRLEYNPTTITIKNGYVEKLEYDGEDTTIHIYREEENNETDRERLSPEESEAIKKGIADLKAGRTVPRTPNNRPSLNEWRKNYGKPQPQTGTEVVTQIGDWLNAIDNYLEETDD